MVNIESWKGVSSNKVPTKFKIMYARGDFKGLDIEYEENTVGVCGRGLKGE